MSRLKRFLSVLLSAVLLLTWAPLASQAEDIDVPLTEDVDVPAEDIEFPDELIVGHPTITKGDFFTEMFGNDTADIDVRALIHGYNLVNWDQNQGTYVFDPSVVRKVEVQQDELGNKIYTMVLADNLYYSNGEKITAWDYAFSILLMMSPEIEQIGGKIYRAEHLMGYDDYIATRRKVMKGEAINPIVDVDYLSGVTVLGDYQLRFFLNHEFLPYFFETGLLMTVPYPISEIAPGCKVAPGYVDEAGNTLGIKIVNEDESVAEPIYTADLLKKTILDPETGYNTVPAVVSGPYTIKSWDGVTGHFEINEYFKGAWMVNNLPGQVVARATEHGNVVPDVDAFGNPVLDDNGEEIMLVKPTIEKIAFTVADNDTMIGELTAGNLHLVNKVTYAPTITEGLAAQPEIQNDNYPRIGLSFLTFTYEWPTVHDMQVRQAIAWCMDRDLLTREYCGGFGLRMDGYHGMHQWEYMLLTRQIDFPVNFLPTQDALGTPIEYEDEELRQMLNMTNRWVQTEEEYQAALSAWNALATEWDDGEGNTLLTKYTVDLDKANALLNDAKWILNRNGEAYQPGVDDVRCKLVDGEIIPLELKMMYPAGNHMADFMQEEGNFVDNLAQVGIRLELVPTPMEDLLHSYYRETERTTDMIYLATNFHVIVDPSITYSTDSTVGHEVWNNTYSDDNELFYDAVSMRKTEPGDVYEYVSKWMAFQKRYNEVLPTIPIYSNVYFDFFTQYLQNYEITAQVTWSQAILLAYFGLPETPAEEEADELGEDDAFFE